MCARSRTCESIRDCRQDALGAPLPHIVTCHLHDNHGFEDEHLLPGDGTICWPRLLNRLQDGASRLKSVQNEANSFAHNIPAEVLAERFRILRDFSERL